MAFALAGRSFAWAAAELGLGGAHLSQKRHRVERAMHAPQTRLGGPSDLRMPNRALKGSRRRVVALDDLGTLAPLLLQLERWLEEVHVQARGRIEPSHDLCRLDAFETAVADQPAHHSSVLLLDECLVVLLVGA